ncbi:hypothetical protein Tco_1377549 [Tanacetum coccineum]
MLLSALGIDQNIIDEHDHESIQIRFAHPIHQIHEYCRCVSQPKRHYLELVVTIAIPKCSLWNVFLMNSKLVITRSQVDIRVDSRPLELIKQVVDSRKWVLVLHSANRYGARATGATPGTKSIEIQLVKQVVVQASILERLLEIPVQLAHPQAASPLTCPQFSWM